MVLRIFKETKHSIRLGSVGLEGLSQHKKHSSNGDKERRWQSMAKRTGEAALKTRMEIYS